VGISGKDRREEKALANSLAVFNEHLRQQGHFTKEGRMFVVTGPKVHASLSWAGLVKAADGTVWVDSACSGSLCAQRGGETGV
jgi:hypothetical protein